MPEFYNMDIYSLIQKGVIEKYPMISSMTRKDYKGIIMRLTYGESVFTWKEIFDTFLGSEYQKTKTDTPQELSKKAKFKYSIAKEYDEVLFRELSDFKLFKEQIDKIVKVRTKLNLDINLSVSDIFSSTQYYNVDKATTYSYRTYDGRRKRVTMHIPEKINAFDSSRFEAKPNTKKIMRATLPNLVHHIDSILAHMVITQFRQHKKPIYTIHDAFYVRLVDIVFAQESYFKALKQLHDSNPWQRILEKNKIDLSLKKYSHLNIKDQEKAKDLNYIIDNEFIPESQIPNKIDFSLKMSHNILL